jgi:hypothetical protein
MNWSGHIIKQEALPRLVRAIALMREPVDVAIVGAGEDFPAVQALVSALKFGNVRLTGAQHG